MLLVLLLEYEEKRKIEKGIETKIKYDSLEKVGFEWFIKKIEVNSVVKTSSIPLLKSQEKEMKMNSSNRLSCEPKNNKIKLWNTL